WGLDRSGRRRKRARSCAPGDAEAPNGSWPGVVRADRGGRERLPRHKRGSRERRTVRVAVEERSSASNPRLSLVEPFKDFEVRVHYALLAKPLLNFPASGFTHGNPPFQGQTVEAPHRVSQ